MTKNGSNICLRVVVAGFTCYVSYHLAPEWVLQYADLLVGDTVVWQYSSTSLLTLLFSMAFVILAVTFVVDWLLAIALDNDEERSLHALRFLGGYALFSTVAFVSATMLFHYFGVERKGASMIRGEVLPLAEAFAIVLAVLVLGRVYYVLKKGAIRE